MPPTRKSLRARRQVSLGRTDCHRTNCCNRPRATACTRPDRRGPLYDIVRKYFQALVAAVMQTAACNGLHTAHQRCARWLLQSHDRVGRDQFELTQELLAVMLGVRRATITLIATDMQRAGLIEFERRGITILSQTGLEEMACECYRVIRKQYDRLLSASSNF